MMMMTYYFLHYYLLSDFKNHFRMSRATFEILTTQVAPFLGNRTYIELNKKLLLVIWLLAKPESFLAAGDRFGISKGTAHYVFLEIISAVLQLQEHYISWPNRQQINAICARCELRSGIPGIVGAIDGTHIIIKQRVHNAVDYYYYYRKEQHSVILQGVCDDRKMFLDIFVGMPGRMHDARVFRNSPIYHRLIDNPSLLPPQQHILGDAAYPLMENLLKPYVDNGHLSRAQLLFNVRLSNQRSIIERAFGLLKGRWRRLKYLDMSLQQQIPNVIATCCILHSLILIKEDDNNMDIHLDDSEQEIL